MVRRLLSVLATGIIGAAIISLIIPILLLVYTVKPVPEDQVLALSMIVERLWLTILSPIVLFLTGVLAAHLARRHLKGLIDCAVISVSAGAIALLPGLVLLMNHIGGFSMLMLAAFSVAMLLASIAGSFLYYYFLRIRAKTL